MGVTPSTGYYLDNYFGYRNTRYSNGETYESVFELPGIAAVTEFKFLDGTYSAAFFPAGLIQIDQQKNGKTTTRVNVGDMYAVPFKLTWTWTTASFGFFNGIIIPTGPYQAESSLNSGQNYWTLDNNVIFTWRPKGGYEISLDAGYMVNLRNQATQYRTGDEFHLNYLIGYHLSDNLGLGVFGAYYQQVTEDDALPGTRLNARGEFVGIGPVVMYNLEWGDRSIYLSAKWLHVIDTEDSGTVSDFLMFRTSFPF